MKKIILLKNKLFEFLFPNSKKKTMNKVQKILVDFSRFTSSDLVTKAQTVIDSLTGNPDVPTPTPTVAVLQAGVDDLMAAITAAEQGGKQQRELRDQAEEALIALLKQEAAYVSMIANGNVATMIGAGFDVSKIPSPIGPLPKPKKFQVSSPRKGWLQLSLESIRGAKNYYFQYKKAGDTEWTIVPSTTAKLTVMGLESAKEYIARVMPVGASKDRSYSDEISAVVI